MKEILHQRDDGVFSKWITSVVKGPYGWPISHFSPSSSKLQLQLSVSVLTLHVLTLGNQYGRGWEVWRCVCGVIFQGRDTWSIAESFTWASGSGQLRWQLAMQGEERWSTPIPNREQAEEWRIKANGGWGWGGRWPTCYLLHLHEADKTLTSWWFTVEQLMQTYGNCSNAEIMKSAPWFGNTK